MTARSILPLALAVVLFLPQPAVAGPPFVTDDPEPVDYQHWEINSYFAGSHVRGEASGAAPGFDINYGALPNLQLHINISGVYDQLSGGPLYYGYGDTELGVKYRFLDPGKDDWWPQVAIYPLFEVPTGNASKGLGATGEAREFLPVWIQKDFGEWTTYGGVGYWNNPGDGNKNYWFSGWVLQRRISDHLALGGELFHQTADTVITTPTDKSSIGFNLGGTYDLSENYHVLFSAGKGLQNAETTNEFSYYMALQWTF